MKKTVYKLNGKAFPKHLRIALVSDLHSDDPCATIKELEKISPDLILMAGDIVERLDGSRDEYNRDAMSIFKATADISPTFYCTGNHEDGGIHSGNRRWKESQGKKRNYTKENLEHINKSGVHLLLDEFELWQEIAIGGLCSGVICREGVPNLDFVQSFSRIEAPKILICHHPEYYPQYLKDLPIDLIVSGHAHGGQWRIFGKGVYAPGQGILPKYTSGIHNGKLVISRGLKKPFPIPRFFNRREIVIIET